MLEIYKSPQLFYHYFQYFPVCLSCKNSFESKKEDIVSRKVIGIKYINRISADNINNYSKIFDMNIIKWYLFIQSIYNSNITSLKSISPEID